MQLTNMKVGTRIGLGLGILAVLILVMAGVGLNSLRALNVQVTLLTEDRVPKLQKVAAWEVSLCWWS